MKSTPILSFQELTLRPLVPADLEEYYRLGFAEEDAEVMRLTGTTQHFSKEQVAAYLRRIEHDETRYDFLILHGDALLGEIVLNEIDAAAGSAGFRIALFRSADCGRGVGQKALSLLFAFAFETLLLKQIELEVLSFNPRARHVYEKLGFRPGQVLPGAYTVDGEAVDALVMTLTPADFRSVLP